MITDFIYDASETSVVGYEECYSPLNGYLIVRQGEKWGIVRHRRKHCAFPDF